MKINELISDLKINHQAIAIKAEFEAEGSRFRDIVKLNSLTDNLLPFYIKIGGCEAITDCQDALNLGAKGIVAPMVESAFALKKFVSMIENIKDCYKEHDVAIGINVETITAYHNLNQIVNTDLFSKINFITIGRTDLSQSMNVDVNSKENLECCKGILSIIPSDKVKCIGGKITNQAIPFLNDIKVDRVETRKIIFKWPVVDLELAIKKALQFEYLWLCYKKDYYDAVSKEDDSRLTRLKGELCFQ